MTPDQVLTVVVNDVRAMIREAADERVRFIKSGMLRMGLSPFSGEPAVVPASEAAREFGAVLAGHGLNKDERLLAALRELLLDAAAEPMFRLFAALDGEGAFSQDIKLEVRMLDGERLPTYVHEVLQPVDEARK